MKVYADKNRSLSLRTVELVGIESFRLKNAYSICILGCVFGRDVCWACRYDDGCLADEQSDECQIVLLRECVIGRGTQ